MPQRVATSDGIQSRVGELRPILDDHDVEADQSRLLGQGLSDVSARRR